jgi:plasmid rolling circle replication initiator protein Rep
MKSTFLSCNELDNELHNNFKVLLCKQPDQVIDANIYLFKGAHENVRSQIKQPIIANEDKGLADAVAVAGSA